MPTADFMCLDGEIVRYQDARIHAFAGVVKYGCGVFEGIRAYWSAAERELFVFRLAEHLERLRFGMKLMRYAEIYPRDYLEDCVLRMLRANELRENVHIRVIAYLGGDDELAQGAVTLRDLDSGSQELVSLAALTERLARYR